MSIKFLDKLNSRERKTVVLCGISGIGLLLYFVIAEPLIRKAADLRMQLDVNRQKARILLAPEGSAELLKQKSMTLAVPVMDMPARMDKQSVLFRDKLTQQLQQSGIQVKSLQFITAAQGSAGGSGMLFLQCKGRCAYESLGRFLDELKKNPYYAGVEELTLRVDDKNRQEMELSITVSTFTESGL